MSAGNTGYYQQDRLITFYGDSIIQDPKGFELTFVAIQMWAQSKSTDPTDLLKGLQIADQLKAGARVIEIPRHWLLPPSPYRYRVPWLMVALCLLVIAWALTTPLQ